MSHNKKKKKKRKKPRANNDGTERPLQIIVDARIWPQSVIWVVVVLRSPIHANEPSEYNGMLYRTSNRVLNNGIKLIILICMDGTSQYHHHRDLACLEPEY